LSRGKSKRLRAEPPSLHETREGRHLLVWGDLGQWLVVDDELWALLEALDGRYPLRKVLRGHAKRWRKSFATVEREAAGALAALEERGIVTTGSGERMLVEEPISIANVTVNLTNKCNLKCGFCYNIRRRTPEMPVSELMDAFEDGREVLEKDAAFIILGGEPTLDLDRLFVALERAEGLFGPAPLVSTNGTLLSDVAVTQLAERRVEVQVSIDSHVADRHDAGRGRGTHSKAIAGIERLVEAGVYTIMSMVYDRTSYLDLEPYLDLASSLGVNEARLIPLRLIGGGLDAVENAPDQRVVLEHGLEVLERRPDLG